MTFTHYQKAGDKVFEANPYEFVDHFGINEEIRQAYNEFETWLSIQPQIYADPSIKDGVMYKVDELEIVWQWKPRENYPFDGPNDPMLFIKDWQNEDKDDWDRKDISYINYSDFASCLEWGFYTRQIATLKQPVKEEEKPITKIMNAQEAREQALSVTQGAAAVQLKAIKDDIEKAVRQGSLSTNWYDSILPQVRTALEQEGFSVSPTDSFHNEYSTHISW